VKTKPNSDSYFVAKLDRAGFLGFLGHKHSVLATEWSSDICVSKGSLNDTKAKILIPVESLVIDTKEAIEKAGLEPSSLGEESRNKLQKKMLSSKFLDQKKYPQIIFNLSSFNSTGPSKAQASGTITIRERSNEVTFPVDYCLSENEFKVRGELEVKHTDFGMEPESMGPVKVANKIKIKFHLIGPITNKPCDSKE
jgi:polyisoprenoid-binding protein YceI